MGSRGGRVLVLALACLGSPRAAASPAEIFGFGGAEMGRGKGGVALPGDGASALLNPAALAGLGRPEVSVGWALLRMRFSELPGVWWDTNRDGSIDELDRPLDPSPRPEPADGLMIGVASPAGGRFGGGLSLFLPRDRILRLETFDPSIPTWFLYDNRPYRYVFAMGAGARVGRGLSVGAGVRVVPRARYEISATVTAAVDGGAGGADAAELVDASFDVHEMLLDLVLDYAPQLGFRWQLGELLPALDGFSVGGGWRGEAGLPVDVTVDLQVDGALRNVGDLDPLAGALVAVLDIGVFDHYLPPQGQLGLAWSPGRALRLYADAEWTRWSRMRLSIAHLVDASVQATGVDLGGVVVADGNPAGAVFRDTLSGRVGTELFFPRWSLAGRVPWVEAVARGGISYEPSPLAGQTADTALLDSDRVLLATGLGLRHPDPFDGERAWRWDAFFQLHVLASGVLQRPDPDGPRPGYAVDGSPIPMGGRFLVGGLQWSAEL